MESEFWPYYLQSLLLKTQSTHRILELDGRQDPLLASDEPRVIRCKHRITFEPLPPRQLPLPVSLMSLYCGPTSNYESLLWKKCPSRLPLQGSPLASSFGSENPPIPTPHLLTLTGPETLAAQCFRKLWRVPVPQFSCCRQNQLHVSDDEEHCHEKLAQQPRRQMY